MVAKTDLKMFVQARHLFSVFANSSIRGVERSSTFQKKIDFATYIYLSALCNSGKILSSPRTPLFYIALLY
jgi:hypothetical protein